MLVSFRNILMILRLNFKRPPRLRGIAWDLESTRLMSRNRGRVFWSCSDFKFALIPSSLQTPQWPISLSQPFVASLHNAPPQRDALHDDSEKNASIQNCSKISYHPLARRESRLTSTATQLHWTFWRDYNSPLLTVHFAKINEWARKAKGVIVVAFELSSGFVSFSTIAYISN